MKENIRVVASATAPDPKEYKYWIDLTESPEGTAIKVFSTRRFDVTGNARSIVETDTVGRWININNSDQDILSAKDDIKTLFQTFDQYMSKEEFGGAYSSLQSMINRLETSIDTDINNLETLLTTKIDNNSNLIGNKVNYDTFNNTLNTINGRVSTKAELDYVNDSLGSLQEAINNKIGIEDWNVATPTSDGLMDQTDKVKINKLFSKDGAISDVPTNGTLDDIIRRFNGLLMYLRECQILDV